MRISIVFSILLSMFSFQVFSQPIENTATKRNGIYAETYLIRNDFSEGFVSINYARTVGKKLRTNLRIGAYPDFQSTVSFPLTVSRLTNPLGHHHFEYGAGIVFRVEHFVDPYGYTSREWFYDIPAIMFPIMYRYQKSAGFYFRAGFNLFVSWPTLPSPSISIGYQF